MFGLHIRAPLPALLGTVISIAVLVLSSDSAGTLPGASDLPASSDAVNAASVATGVSILATRITRCPRCGGPDLIGGKCRKCGLRFSDNLLPHVRSSPARIRTDIRSITQTDQAINRSMRAINESVRVMQRDITRIRNLNRRLR